MAVLVILLSIILGLHGRNTTADGEITTRNFPIYNSSESSREKFGESALEYPESDGYNEFGDSRPSNDEVNNNIYPNYRSDYTDSPKINAGAAVTEKDPVYVDVCSVCACGEIKAERGDEIVLNILCSELDRVVDIPDLNRLLWPKNNHGLRVEAIFEGIGLTTVESLPTNNLLTSLRFTNNLIKTNWPGAFSDLPNLQTLSLSRNRLEEIARDTFAGLKRLETLDLSHNRLTEFRKLDFAQLKRLRTLDLQDNMIDRVPDEILGGNGALEELNLGNNVIAEVKFKNGSNLMRSLKKLYLNGNNITRVAEGDFPDNNIEHLDLSSNAITTIDKMAFDKCSHLEELNLAFNQITSPFSVPVSTLSVSLAHNRLEDWPQFPLGITDIDMSYNALHSLYDQNYVDFDLLQTLKLAGNELTKFELNIKLPKTHTLDISHNDLEEIPHSINSEMLPELLVLRLDGNPFKTIYFPEKISLSTVYLNDLRISSINNGSFINVVPRNESASDDCIRLYITNCPELDELSENAFEGPNICLLDVSYNNLTRLPKGLVDWSSVSEGLNLQGNPWNCGCEMQWVLDTLLLQIHQNYPHYLSELRCETPRARQGLRWVHWLNWGDVWCTGRYRSGPNQSYMLDRDSGQLVPGVSTLALILGACIVSALLVVTGLTVYLVRMRNRSYRIRRAIASRRRQAPQDANGHAEQFKALNRA